MTRQLAPIVEAQDDVVLDQTRVDGGHALFQLLVQLPKKGKVKVIRAGCTSNTKAYLQLDPHAKEDGSRIHDQPDDSASKKLDTLATKELINVNDPSSLSSYHSLGTLRRVGQEGW